MLIEDRGATIEDRDAVAFLSTTAFHIFTDSSSSSSS